MEDFSCQSSSEEYHTVRRGGCSLQMTRAFGRTPKSTRCFACQFGKAAALTALRFDAIVDCSISGEPLLTFG